VRPNSLPNRHLSKRERAWRFKSICSISRSGKPLLSIIPAARLLPRILTWDWMKLFKILRTRTSL